MGGLAHFFEDEGVPTTQISLIREHTAFIKPPRALWVPFELGRPLGVPNDRQFQKKVLLAALSLLETKKGPVLSDFPDDAPDSGEMAGVLSCPVDLAMEGQDLSETGQLSGAFRREMTQLRPWYDLSVKKRGRTTVGASGLDIDTIGDFVVRFLDGEIPKNPREDIPVVFTLKLSVDDLKAYYFEAVSAQPGQEKPGSNTFARWFWDETIAGKILFTIKKRCLESGDEGLRLVGNMVIPALEAHRRR